MREHVVFDLSEAMSRQAFHLIVGSQQWFLIINLWKIFHGCFVELV